MSNLLDVNAGVDAAIIGEGSDVSHKSAWGLMIRISRGRDCVAAEEGCLVYENLQNIAEISASPMSIGTND